MSAAAHLLRRRISSLRQQRHQAFALLSPSLIHPIQSRNPAFTLGSRKLSATTTTKPQENSSSKGLKYTAAATAVLLLSSAAWYTTRDEYSQVQHFGLPQLFHGHLQEEEKASIAVDERSLHLPQSDQSEEEVTKGDAAEESVVLISSEHERADQGRVFDNSTESNVPSTHFEDNGHDQLGQTPPPPVDPEQMPVVLEHHSGQQETNDDRKLPVQETEDEAPDRKESKPETDHSVEENPQEGSQIGLRPLAEVVEEKVHNLKEYFLDESKDVSEDEEVAFESREDIDKIRKKLLQENPEMFYSDASGDEGDDVVIQREYEESGGRPILLEMLESGSHEYGGTDTVPSTLSASYLVLKGHEDSVRRYSEQEKEVKDFVGTLEKSREEKHNREESRVAEDRSVVGVEFLLGAIHNAQQLQAEVDGRTFQEQINQLQEAHKRELNDFQAKIFAYAEDTDQLEKELKKEKEEAVAALKEQKNIAEGNLKTELKMKEEAANVEKERIRLLGQAQTAAIVTREKAEHLDDIYSVQLQVDALRTAFYTRSEEARISHTAHKLAMGAFALEDAIERGEPVKKEAVLLIASAGGPGADLLVDAVVSSLPSEALTAGTSSRAQLHQKFTGLKSTLKELALMPSAGGGVFAHLLARIAAKLKISEQGSDYVGNNGIEVVIGKVERFLAEERLVEAAALLEEGAKGTAAEGLAVEWAIQVRNRAIIEQGLQALRAHVIAVASGLS